MKKLVLILMATGMLAFSASAMAADKLVIKSSDVHGDGYPTVEAIKYMGELLSKWTGGRLSIEVYGSMQLGGEKEALEQVQLGALEMTRVSVGVVGPIVDEFNAFNLPFVFRSSQHMYDVTDGEIGTSLLNKLEKGGLIGLGYMDAGSRSFYNQVRPISKPEDLKGLKIRVMQNPIFVEMVNSMGGNGTPVAFNELYTALQTGVVDGAENNPPTIIEHKHYEVTKYYSLTQHLMVPEIFVFSKKVWDKLTPLDQQLIRKASAMCVEKERELWAAKEEKAFAELKKLNYAVNGGFDKEPFIKATEPVRQKFGGKYAELIKQIQAVK
jgi:tripartite ATP-independent transporter DctP family solute receptor